MIKCENCSALNINCTDNKCPLYNKYLAEKRERLGMFISTPDDKCDGCDRGCPISAKCSRVK